MGTDPDPGPDPVIRTLESFDLADVVVAVVETVAGAKGVDVTDVSARLHDAIDADALARTVESTDGLVAFTMAGCTVVVHGGGRVVATPQPSVQGVRTDDRETARTGTESPRSDGRSSI